MSALSGAGYSDPEIARFLDLTVKQIHSLRSAHLGPEGPRRRQDRRELIEAARREGLSWVEIASALGISANNLGQWRRRHMPESIESRPARED